MREGEPRDDLDDGPSFLTMMLPALILATFALGWLLTSLVR